MSNEDSRDNETPDRHAQPPTNYRPLLEALDTHTTHLLETVTTDDDLEPETRQAATRHCRELRAELECVRRHLPKADAPEPLATITGPFEADWEAMRRRNARDADPRVDEPGGEGDE